MRTKIEIVYIEQRIKNRKRAHIVGNIEQRISNRDYRQQRIKTTDTDQRIGNNAQSTINREQRIKNGQYGIKNRE